MNWAVFWSAFLGSGLGIVVVGYLARTLLEHWLNIDRSKQEEQRQLLQKRRKSNTVVVDILSEWLRSAYIKPFTNEDRWRLQTTYWKNILWLDKELLDILLPRLANAKNALPTKEVIVQARKLLHGLSKADIKSEQLNSWDPE
ncbi:MAG: hypothetical protein ABSA16_02735 [Thermoguttaceae bacterium]|jgi:hypothetical protein